MHPLPTTVVGSYPVPEWMERLKTEYLRGRMSYAQLNDVHEMAIKAALHDQERAGIDIVSDGVDVTWALHVCYGNRYSRPLWQGHYDFLFPAVLNARVDQLVLEFARKGYEDLPSVSTSWDRAVGLGVIDVKSSEVETPELVASRIRAALSLVPADRLIRADHIGSPLRPAELLAARGAVREAPPRIGSGPRRMGITLDLDAARA